MLLQQCRMEWSGGSESCAWRWAQHGRLAWIWSVNLWSCLVPQDQIGLLEVCQEGWESVCVLCTSILKLGRVEGDLLCCGVENNNVCADQPSNKQTRSQTLSRLLAYFTVKLKRLGRCLQLSDYGDRAYMVHSILFARSLDGVVDALGRCYGRSGRKLVGK